MAELMKIVRSCYFEGCNKDIEVEFKDFVYGRIAQYCRKCATPLDVKRTIETQIDINCPRCLKFNRHKIVGKTTKHIIKCKMCKLVFRFKEVY